MMTKKNYTTPALTKLTPGQAKKLIMERRNCSEEEADAFLESLRREQKLNEDAQNEAPSADEQKRKRSA